MANTRVHLIIEGRVQGVWFRESTRREAVSLGVSGWVRNLPGGMVEALLEGPETQVNELVLWCYHGPLPLGWTGSMRRRRNGKANLSLLISFFNFSGSGFTVKPDFPACRHK